MQVLKKGFVSFLSLVLSVLFVSSTVFAAEARGIYSLDDSNGTYRDANIRNYPFVEGFAWRYRWNNMESKQNGVVTYDFSAVDHIVSLLEPIGKKLSMTVPRPEPDYIRNDTTIQRWYSYEILNGETTEIGWRPVPWEPKVKTALQNFAVALANHSVWSSTLNKYVAFKDHPTLSSINFGLPGAKIWIRDPGSTEGPKLKDMPGYSRANLLNAVSSDLHAATDNFPNISSHIGIWKVTNDGGATELYEDIRTSILNEFNGISNPKVGFFQENLAASRTNPGDPVVGTPNTTFAQPLYDSRNDTFIGFQMLESWINPFKGIDQVANTKPSDAIEYAYNTYNSRYTEVYADDLDQANSDSSWDPALLTWNDKLKADFYDDFADGNATGWTELGGTWSVTAQKAYQQSNITAANPSSYAGSSSWTNYAVEAKVKPLTLGSSGQVGISARFTDNANRYYFDYAQADGKLKIIKKVNGNSTLLASKVYTINPNTQYTFKADLNGSTLDFYVNGVKELSATDTTFTSGYFALSTATATAEFDDVKVFLH